ncbi:MAG: CDP-diacylglycerol--glycerol-3-phosphate 3-phosphatidyltransferase [Actinobacteria bacterium]|nr:CDP-diacylglycerol--glycerol-3-phosphate 3-phosphatidyltransferase [Actinomycetota bacterium]
MSPLGLGWPNLISIFRILLVPPLVLLVVDGRRAASVAATVVFVVGALTDGLDGYLARRYDSVTRTGQWLDPLSDKVFVSAPVMALTLLGRFPLWAAAVIVVREIAVSVLRAYLGTRGQAMPASPLGKAKTAAQLIVIVLYLLPDPVLEVTQPLGDIALFAAVALTVWSGLDYVLKALRPARGTPT